MRIRKAVHLAAIIAMALVVVPPTTADALTPAELRTRISALKGSLGKVSARLDAAERSLDVAETAARRHTRAVQQASLRKAEITEVFRERAADLYMHNTSVGLDMLAAPDDLDMFLQRVSYLEQVNSEQRGMLEELAALQDRAAQESRSLARARARAARSRTTLASQQRELSARLRELEQLQRFLDGARAIMRGSRSARGFVCPVMGPNVVSNNFGDPRPGGPHQGDDIRADIGQGVRAVLPGTIADAPIGSWWGIGIVLRDLTGTEWWYAHLSSSLVAPGQRVLQGEVIGRVGCTGRCYGPHLHFEWHPGGGAARDPYRILSSAC